MIFNQKEFTTKDGRTCILRPVTTDDAAEMITQLQVTSAETPFLIRTPEEANLSLEDERRFLQGRVDAARELMMIAEVDGKIAGSCGIEAKAERKRILHRCGFGIALKKEYWHLGIATEMIAYTCELAKSLHYEQVELEVVEGNDRAQVLYEHCSFTVIGHVPHAMRYDDGSYRDETVMVKFL